MVSVNIYVANKIVTWHLFVAFFKLEYYKIEFTHQKPIKLNLHVKNP